MLIAFLLLPLLLLPLFPLLLFPLLLFPLPLLAFLLFSLLLLSLLLISLLPIAFLLISLLLFPLLLLAFSLLLFLLLIGLPKHHLHRDGQGKRKHQYGGCPTDLPNHGSDYRKENGLMRQTFVHTCCLHSAGSPSAKNPDSGAATIAGVTFHNHLGAARRRKDTLVDVNVLRDRGKEM